MKRMSLLSLAVALLLSVWMVAPAAAQRGPHERRANPEQRIERHINRLDRTVDLSDEQEAQLKTLLQAQHEEARAWLDANEDASREDKRAHFEAQAEATKAAIASVLTAEQQQTLEEKRTERGERGRFQRGPQGGKGMGRLAEELDLTEAQQAQLKELHAAQREAVKAWMDANPNATREEKKAHREEQMEAHRNALNSVLTPEQQQVLEARKDEWENHRGGDHMRRGKRGHRGGDGFAELNLTEAQRSQLQELREAHREEMKAWGDANPNATREEKQAYRKGQMASHRAALESILTPEQQQILEERRAEWMNRRGRNKEGSNRSSEDMEAAPSNEASASRFGLSNYPNPFNPSTEIRFELPEASRVSLVVYDVQGREVSTLVDEHLGAGEHAATFNAANLPTGTYLYRLTVGSVTQTGRMVLMK